MHRYVREADRVLAYFDLTHLQFQTLALAAWLGRSGEPVTQVDLARAGDIGTMQVSQMMKALESKGWVKRVRSPSDFRAKNVVLSPEGIAVLHRAFPPMIELQRKLFGRTGRPADVCSTRCTGPSRRHPTRSRPRSLPPQAALDQSSASRPAR